MYTMQALWTQARERLSIITIVCDNSQYAILRIEGAKQRLPPAGPAMRSLTDLGSPRIDWVALAKGMGVPAVRVESCEELREVLQRAISERTSDMGQGPAETEHGKRLESAGPILIQACI